MDLTDFGTRAEQIVELADAVLATYRLTDYGEECDHEAYAVFRASALSFLSNTFGESHPYFREFSETTKVSYRGSTEAGRGIVLAAKSEVSGGWAAKARGLIAAEIFADFIEMAEHLLDEGYKDAAAVMTGSTLEEHLRQLAKKYNIALQIQSGGRVVSKKADVINAELVKAGAYNTMIQKMVTAWLDLRNKAAHGEYEKYSKENVSLMWQGVVQFISQHPA